MAVPKKKSSKSRRNMRRSHLKLDGATAVKCPQCTDPVKPHTVCKSCGYYKGKQVIAAKE